MSNKTINAIGKESTTPSNEDIVKQVDGEGEIIINEEDEHLGIYHLSKEELIDTIREIREEFFELQDDHDQLENKYKEKTKEVETNRKLLTEREDLLLQLQWDPQEDSSYFQQMGASDSSQANELKMKAMMDQMRVMERGVFERDEKIKQMEKMIEQFTLAQINSGIKPTEIIYSQFGTIVNGAVPTTIAESTSSPSISSNAPSASNIDSPSPFDSISKYPLSKKIFDNIEQAVNVLVAPSSPSSQQPPSELNRSVSFWKSPTTFISNLLGKSSDQDVKNNNNNNTDDNENQEDNEEEEDEEEDDFDSRPFSVPVEVPPNFIKA